MAFKGHEPYTVGVLARRYDVSALRGDIVAQLIASAFLEHRTRRRQLADLRATIEALKNMKEQQDKLFEKLRMVYSASL